MKQFKLLGEITFSQELISRTENTYLRIEVKPMLISVGSLVVTQEQLGLTINKPLSVYKLPAHVGNSVKCVVGNIVILNISEHIADTTSYIKDGIEVLHDKDALNVDFVELLSDIELFDMFENKIISKEKYEFLERKLERARKTNLYK